MQCSSLTSCSTFTPNYWAPAKCANCYKPEAAHTYTSVISSDQSGGRRNIKLRTNFLNKAEKRRNPHPTTSPSSSSPSLVRPKPLLIIFFFFRSCIVTCQATSPYLF